MNFDEEVIETLKHAYKQEIPRSDHLHASLRGALEVDVETKKYSDHLQIEIDIRKKWGKNYETIQEGFITRNVWIEKKLMATIGSTGCVLERVLLLLPEMYQRKGIGSTIYDLEDNIYHVCGVQEIQVVAITEGRIVWRKRKFGLSVDPIQLPDIIRGYIQWCDQTNLDNWVSYNFDLENPSSIDLSILRDEFFVSSNCLSNIRMYKTINKHHS